MQFLEKQGGPFFNSFRYFIGYFNIRLLFYIHTMLLWSGLNAGIVLKVRKSTLNCLPFSYYFIFDRIKR